jgi:AcrR family transcriptional regulator
VNAQGAKTGPAGAAAVKRPNHLWQTMRKRLKADERKASIEEISKRLFAEKGLHGVSVDEIAAACGVSPAMLYRHFPSKEALYESVLNDFAGRREDYVEAVLSGPDDFGSVLFRMTLVYVRATLDDPDALRMELHSALGSHATSEKFFSNHWKNFADYIEYTLSELIEAGEIPSVDTRVASLLFQGALRELIYSKRICQIERWSDIDAERLAKGIVNLFLRAVGLGAARQK